MTILRTLPHNSEAEHGLIGSALIQPSLLDELGDRTTPEMFYVPALRTCWLRLLEMRQRGELIDFITLQTELENHGELTAVGGPAKVTELFTYIPMADNAPTYARIIREQAAKRALIEVAQRLVSLAHDPGENLLAQVRELAETAVLDWSRVWGGEAGRGDCSMRESVLEAMDRLQEGYVKSGLLGIPTGITQLDQVSRGWRPGQMIVLAARPSVGKTATMWHMAEAAVRHFRGSGRKAGIITLEMPAGQLVERALVAKSGAPTQDWASHALRPHHWSNINEAGSEMVEWPLMMNDQSAMAITTMRSIIRRWVVRENVGIVFIDYLQNLRGSSKRAEQNVVWEVSEISAAIKACAKDFNIPVVVLSQLNRKVEERKDPQPKLSDLRDSGSIEQDADIILLLSRPLSGKGKESLEINLAKHRNGPLDEIRVGFVDGRVVGGIKDDTQACLEMES